MRLPPHRPVRRARWCAPLITAALLVGVLALASPPSAAAASGGDGGSGDTAVEDPTLVRARSALAGAPGPDASLALRALFRELPRLRATDPERAAEAQALLARPTTAGNNPRTDGYRVPSVRRCGGPICVHSVRTTDDAPRSRAWVRTTLRVARRVWRLQVDTMGYRAPVRDRGRGGDGRLDVYLADVGARGLFGYCVPERRVPGARGTASSYCVLDNDFAREQFAQRPIRSLRVTAAHEMFHAVQFAYDFREDAWFQESTATWMEERAADAADDNRRYLAFGQMRRPGIPLDLFDAGGFAQYGAWPLWEQLTDRFGDQVVREVWERAGAFPGARDEYSAQALRAAMQARGGFTDVFGRYAAANVARGQEYDEGRAWPQPQTAESRRLGRTHPHRRARVQVDHLAAQHVSLRPSPALTPGRWRLRVQITGPAARTRPAAYLVVKRPAGAHLRRVKLDTRGRGTQTVAFSRRTLQVVVTLANASTRYACRRENSSFSCRGTPLDDGEEFRVDARLVRR